MAVEEVEEEKEEEEVDVVAAAKESIRSSNNQQDINSSNSSHFNYTGNKSNKDRNSSAHSTAGLMEIASTLDGPAKTAQTDISKQQHLPI